MTNTKNAKRFEDNISQQQIKCMHRRIKEKVLRIHDREC